MTVQSRVWFNEDLESRNFIIPGVVAVIMALVGAQLTSLTISREWERGTMELLISTPVKPSEVMFGKLAALSGASAGSTRPSASRIAAFWFEVPFRGTAVHAVRHHDAVPDRRARHRLSDLGRDPQPDRREPDRAAGDDAADHAAVRLRVSDRPDADGRSRTSPIWSIRATTSPSSRRSSSRAPDIPALATPILCLLVYAAAVDGPGRARLPQEPRLSPDVRPHHPHPDQGVHPAVARQMGRASA